MKLWTNAHDRDVPVRPGPGAWHRCSRCRTRYRYLGRFVRLTTQPCPGCRLQRQRREAKQDRSFIGPIEGEA